MLKYFKAKFKPNHKKIGLVCSNEEDSLGSFSKPQEIKNSGILEKIPVPRSSKILVLDLDETLLHSSLHPRKGLCQKVQVEYQRNIVTYFVAKRPGVDKFIRELAKTFTLFVYTSSQKEYAYAMIDFLNLRGIVKEIYHRDHCKPTHYGYIKDLSILRKSFKDLILLDDSVHQVNKQAFNSLQVQAFHGETYDNQLEALLPILVALAEEEDVRPVHQKALSILRRKSDLTDRKIASAKERIGIRTMSCDKVVVKKAFELEKANEVDENDECEMGEFEEHIDYSQIPIFDCSKLTNFISEPKRSQKRNTRAFGCLTPKTPKGSSRNRTIQSFGDCLIL